MSKEVKLHTSKTMHTDVYKIEKSSIIVTIQSVKHNQQLSGELDLLWFACTPVISAESAD